MKQIEKIDITIGNRKPTCLSKTNRNIEFTAMALVKIQSKINQIIDALEEGGK